MAVRASPSIAAAVVAVLAAALLLAAPAPAHAASRAAPEVTENAQQHAGEKQKTDPGGLPLTTVRDLQYGDVLFYYYQGEDFEALTRLEAYQHWKQLGHHDFDARLLQAGLYLSLGLYQEAGNRFAQLLTDAVPQGVRDRAWFHLGQIRYARGELESAVQALRQVHGTLPTGDDAQRVHLLANALVRMGRYDEAISLLEGFKGPADWTAYARFNLGVALVRANRMADADRFLTTVGTAPATQEELLALRDRANLALGFAWLQADRPADARVPLARVRLNGPYSNKALLGLGWADVALQDYPGALAPWTELRKRSLLDSAVQESWLAVPYAYARLEDGAQAATGYESALDAFGKERRRLDESIDHIRAGGLTDTLLKDDKAKNPGWFWQLPTLPDVPESRYLYPILAGHDFQEGLKNYRDLRFMGATLDAWEANGAAFASMIDARERADTERQPRARELLASGAADSLRQRRGTLASRLDAIEEQHDPAALASPEERGQWDRMQDLSAALADAPAGPDTAQAQDRLRLVKGVLQYQLDAGFKERLWHQRRALRDIDQSLRDAQSRWFALQETLGSAPADTRAFAGRLAVLQKRIKDLQVRMAGTERRQGTYLQRLTVAQLQAQKDRLTAYESQARFELAGLYDKAQQDARPGQGAAGQPPDARPIVPPTGGPKP